MQQGKENELLGVILHASSTTTGLIDRWAEGHWTQPDSVHARPTHEHQQGVNPSLNIFNMSTI